MGAQRLHRVPVGGRGCLWVHKELGGVTEAKSPTEPRAGPMNRSSRHRRFSEWHQEMLGRLVGCHLRQCSQLALPLGRARSGAGAAPAAAAGGGEGPSHWSSGPPRP